MSHFKQLLSPLLRRFRTLSTEHKNDDENDQGEATTSPDTEATEAAEVAIEAVVAQNKRRQVVDLGAFFVP